MTSTRFAPRPSLARSGPAAARSESIAGFTLVELLIAITAGLFVALGAFGLARQGSRFFQQEARIANAQFSAALGLDRLRADLTRAAFLGTPNVQLDPRVCRNRSGGGGTTDPTAGQTATWPTGVRALAALKLEQNGTQDTTIGLSADRIWISGAFASEELFPLRAIVPNGSKWDVYLQATSGAMLRATSGQVTTTALSGIFSAGRILRVLDSAGRFEFGVIESAAVESGNPVVHLAASPALPFRSGGGNCGIEGNGTGMQASVVSWIRYEISDLRSSTTYAPLYASNATAPGDDSRRELVRTEYDATMAAMSSGPEIVAEYAVDLKFGFTVATAGTSPTLTRYELGDTNNATYAGDITGNSAAPQRIRGVRTRLAVRSREGDRAAAAPSDAGLLRYALNNGLGFARVRTLTAEIVLPNLLGATW